MLTPSEKSTHILAQLKAFMSEHIYPNEVPYRTALHQAENRFASMPLMDSLKEQAKAAGLWNLFVPPEFAEFAAEVHGLDVNAPPPPLPELFFDSRA